MTAAHKPCFGSIQLRDGFWQIACEPHIRLLLRRLFPAVSQRPGDVIHLSNTISNSRDLLWFTERYPMHVEQLAYLHEQAGRHVESESMVDALLSERRPPEHIELIEPARPYQLVAASLLAIKGGLLLADRVGLGKTVSAICSMVNPENLPALVVCEPHLVSQWVAFCKRFLGQRINVHVIKSTKMYPLIPSGEAAAQGALFDAPRLPDVIVFRPLRTQASGQGFYMQARAIEAVPRAKKNYWVVRREMFARAFESYVEDLLSSAGRCSPYLVFGTQIPGEQADRWPYPLGKERESISTLLASLLLELRSPA